MRFIHRSLLTVVFAVGAAACGDTSEVTPTNDTGVDTSETTEGDAEVPDADIGEGDDASDGGDDVADAMTPGDDVGADVADAAEDAADAAEDAADATENVGDASADVVVDPCAEPFVDPIVVRCGGELMEAGLSWVPGQEAACPPTYIMGGSVVYDSFEALVAATGCDDCLYTATMAASFLTCQGPKSGWEKFEVAAEKAETCGEAYRTADGLFADLCEWSAYACYCEE